jgi:uncharacterized protein YutE (UPF0331/DUF86 family)
LSPEANEIIADRLRHLREYLTDLAEHDGCTWEAFSGDKVLRRFVERTLHLASECCLDIGNHLISARGLREPDSNRDVFQVLEEAGLLTGELATRMKDMASFRNVIVHDYTRVDPAIVFGIFKRRRADLDDFGRAIRAFLADDTAP